MWSPCMWPPWLHDASLAFSPVNILISLAVGQRDLPLLLACVSLCDWRNDSTGVPEANLAPILLWLKAQRLSTAS
jgi:hypothetical protein